VVPGKGSGLLYRGGVTTGLNTYIAEMQRTLPLMLSVQAAAEVAQCSPSSIRRAIDAGKLSYNQRERRGCIYVPRDELLTWAFSLDVRSQPEPSAPPRNSGPKRKRGQGSAPASPSKRRPALRAMPTGASAWSEAQMLDFAAQFEAKAS
jgi:hypothetical protein